MSHGGICMVGTPLQKSLGIVDTPELAEQDFFEWGGDPDREWVRYYVHNSRSEIHDWLRDMGVGWDSVLQIPGNSVPRFHETIGRGLGLVTPIYRECVENANVSFRWNFKVTGLIKDQKRAVGVRGQNMRTGETGELRARAVVLATGGFQSNLNMVREFWPKNLAFPERILVGSGVNSLGSGHEMARSAGAAFHRMDHQWNYATGLPDPRYPNLNRGLNADNDHAIWVNRRAQRFVNEVAGTKVAFPALLAQEAATYWAIFDEPSKHRFWVSGSGWEKFETIEALIFSNTDLVKTAGSIGKLATAVGLDASTLLTTVGRYNDMVEKGIDEDFGRFDEAAEKKPPKINEPPFYAVQFFPLTRKSMGGITIDNASRVLDRNGSVIAGLYAAGEVTGMGGINGWAGLEGTFLGPSIVTGRVAARTILRELGRSSDREPMPALATGGSSRAGPNEVSTSCKECHDLPMLVGKPRPGYSHFEKVHRVVLVREYDCSQCHQELFPYNVDAHQIDRLAQIDNCTFCHVAEEH